jgi:hypothetical protein
MVWPARPQTQHDYHPDTKVKPEAATAGIELVMMRLAGRPDHKHSTTVTTI